MRHQESTNYNSQKFSAVLNTRAKHITLRRTIITVYDQEPTLIKHR